MRFAIQIFIEASSKEEAIARRVEGEIGSVAVVNQFGGHISSLPINPEPWPMLLLPLKGLAKERDRGAGDIIARVIGPIGGDAFKNWYKRLFGKDCGCGYRQEVLNARWPL